MLHYLIAYTFLRPFKLLAMKVCECKNSFFFFFGLVDEEFPPFFAKDFISHLDPT